MKNKLTVLVIIVLMSTPVWADQNTSNLSGKVIDSSGVAIGNATIEILERGSAKKTTIVSNDAGLFSINSLATGTLEMRVAKAGFTTSTLVVDEIRNDILIELKNEDSNSGPATPKPILDKNKPQFIEIYNRFSIEKLPFPIFVDDFLEHTLGGIDRAVMGGADNSNNYYAIDGFHAGGIWTGGTFKSVFVESLDEIRISSVAGATAESGQFTGAKIEGLTMSNNDSISGSASFFYSDEDFVSWDGYGSLENGESGHGYSSQKNLQLGGNIITDRLWAFASVNELDSGNFSEFNLRDEERLSGIFKLDARLSESISMRAFYNYRSRYIPDLYQANSMLISSEAQTPYGITSNIVGASLFWTVDDTTSVSTKVTYRKHDFFTENKNGTAPTYWDNANDTITNNGVVNYEQFSDGIDIQAVLSREVDDFAGSHSYKLGVEYQNANVSSSQQWDIIYIYSGNLEYAIRDYSYPGEQFEVETSSMNAFISDSWSVSESLILNLGLRLDRPTYTIPDQDFSGSERIPGLGDVVTQNNISPRISLVYWLNEKTILRSSYGWYYESFDPALLINGVPQAGSGSQIYYKIGEPYPAERPGEGSPWQLSQTYPFRDFAAIDPDLMGQRADVFTLGIERELSTDISASVDYYYRSTRNIVSAHELTGPFLPGTRTSNGITVDYYTLASATPDLLITNGDNEELYADYSALTFRVNKRFSDSWQLNSSLVLSDHSGVSNFTDFGAVYNIYQNPSFLQNAEGKIETHIPWDFKMSGVYMFPHEISLGALVQYRAGMLWYPRYNLGTTSGTLQLRLEPLGERRLDNYFRTDVRVNKTVRFSRFHLDLMLDVFNLFNSASEVGINSVPYTSNYEETQEQFPRRFQLGVRVSF